MELTEQRGSEQWFQLVHGAQYQEVEHQFLAAVESVNPDNILVSDGPVTTMGLWSRLSAGLIHLIKPTLIMWSVSA